MIQQINVKDFFVCPKECFSAKITRIEIYYIFGETIVGGPYHRTGDPLQYYIDDFHSYLKNEHFLLIPSHIPVEDFHKNWALL